MAIRVHKRTRIVADADVDIRRAIVAIDERYDLTPTEWIAILAGIIQGETKTLIRLERHGNADKPGDQE